MNVRGFTTALLVTLCAGCGGGGGGSNSTPQLGGAGIGGTGITASGTIDGFGSIFVNGIKYETGSAAIVLDNASASESDLKLGMVVTVNATVEPNGTRGTASRIEFDDDIQGPIAAITTNADGSQKTLTIFGTTILADRTSTTFEDVTFATLAVNDVIEVSGFFNAANVIQATRIEKKGAFTPNVSEIEVKGPVSGLSGTQFTLGTLTVDFSSANLSEVPGGTLTNGMLVEVKGTLSGNTLSATYIEQEDDLFDDNVNNVSLEGVITDFVSLSNFKVSGQTINARGAELDPVNLQLRNGVQVEVDGAIVNGVLNAQEVEARSGKIKLASTVQSLNVTGTTGTITLGFATGNVTFQVNSQTALSDDLNNDAPLALASIQVGNFLEVNAFSNGTELIATEVQRETPDDQTIRGPVESFVNGSQITILGLTFNTAGAGFEDANDTPVSSAAFYSLLSQGTLVEITDLHPADGTANEVELED